MLILKRKNFTKTLYHNCDLKDLDKIKREGLIPQAGNLTIGEVADKTNKDIPRVVYLGNKLMADGTGAYRKKHGYSNNEGKTIKVEFTDEEYKNLPIVKNPECLDANNVEEYIKIRKKLNKTGDEKEYRQRWKVINPPYTICIKKKITPDHFKNI